MAKAGALNAVPSSVASANHAGMVALGPPFGPRATCELARVTPITAIRSGHTAKSDSHETANPLAHPPASDYCVDGSGDPAGGTCVSWGFVGAASVMDMRLLREPLFSTPPSWASPTSAVERT